MLRLIKKSIFVLRDYGLTVFLIKAIKWPFNRIINRINYFKQRLIEKKAKKNSIKVVQELNQFNLNNLEEIIDFS